MAKTETIQVRVESDIKRDAEKIFAALGLSAAEAITLFYRQVALHQGLPFTAKTPNAETREAIRQARTGDGLIHYRSVDDLMADWYACLR